MDENSPKVPAAKQCCGKKVASIVVIVLLAVALVAVAVLYVLKLNDTKSQLSSVQSQLKAANQTIENSATTAQFPSKTRFFVVPEWGIKFILPSDLTDTDVVSKINGDKLYLSTTRATALAPGCDLATDPLAVVGRYASDPASGADTVASTGLLGKLGNYYYTIDSAQSGCVNADNSSDSVMSTLSNDWSSIGNMIWTLMTK